MIDLILEQDRNLEETINNYLYGIIPKEEFDRVSLEADISPDFMCFAKTYLFLSGLIPKDWTVIDFGAAYNAQSYFFIGHKAFYAINPMSCEGDNGMFCPPNCEIFRMTTKEFINTQDIQKKRSLPSAITSQIGMGRIA